MTTVTFTVYGPPQPKGSTRAFKRGERIVTTSDNPRLRGWEDAIRSAAQQQVGGVFFSRAVTLHVTFVFQRPRSVSVRKRPHMITRPDLSKLIRGVEDAITEVLWRDDAQVTEILALKSYADLGAPSRVDITIAGLADREEPSHASHTETQNLLV